MAKLNTYITNINKLLKEVKYDVLANFMHLNNKGIVITTKSPRLPQPRSYLKILDILYFVENTNLSITSDIVESVIKSIYIFSNTILVSYP